jgi:maltose O-acetyltransferase
MTGPRPVRSSALRVVTHLVNSVSDIVGDDVLGRWVRRRVLCAAGATVPASSSFHGGTHFSRPANLRVGEDCFVNRRCYLDLDGVVTLEDGVVIGHGVTIVTSTHEMGPSARRAGAVTPLPVTVRRGAWLGANVTVLPGVTIGAGAVAAAGAVVVDDVTPDTLVAGVPARAIRRLDPTGGGRRRRGAVA